MRSVRIDFDKLGESKYISHLDLMRCMSRAVRRAKLPMWYTEGFNPHPYMTFALPLSLGMESECECMDIRVEGEITNDEILSSLQSVMPSGIVIKAVREPVLDAKEIAFGRFLLSFTGDFTADAFALRLRELLDGGELKAEKLSKQGRKRVMKEIDVSTHIKEVAVRTDGEKVTVELLLPAGSTVNVNPSLVADALKNRMPEVSFHASILRKELLTANGEVFR